MPARTSVFLNVKDMDASLKFYKALGFKVTSSTKADGKVAWADLDMDGAELGLGAAGSNDDPEFRSWVSTPLGAGVVVTFSLPRGGVDKVFAKAKKAGAAVEMPPTDRPYGRTAMLNDPEGYVLSLHEDLAPARKAAKRAKKAKSSKKRVKR